MINVNISRIKNQNARLVTGSIGEQTAVVLCSYVVPVAAAVNGKVFVSKGYEHYSVTTSRHIRNFTRGFSAPAEVVEHEQIARLLRCLISRDRLDPI